jgi:hypothetical protein
VSNKSRSQPNSSRDCILLDSSIDSTLKQDFAAFGTGNSQCKVKGNSITNGWGIPADLGQFLEEIAFCSALRSFRRWNRRALRLAYIIQQIQTYNVKVSQTGEEYQRISTKFFKRMHYAPFCPSFDVWTDGSCVRHVICSKSKDKTSKNLKRGRNNGRSQSISSINCIWLGSSLVPTLKQDFIAFGTWSRLSKVKGNSISSGWVIAAGLS